MKPANIIKPGLFEAETDVRRWEFDFKNEIIVTNQSSVDVLFIGDSITHLWELNAYFHHYGLVLNRGIRGDRANFLSLRFAGDAIQLKPRVCVIMIGINNTWYMNETNDMKNTAEETFKLVSNSYVEILEAAKQHRMQIIFCSILPIKGDNIQQKELIVRINTHLQALCVKYGCPYVDYYSFMVAEDGLTLQDGLSPDGVHPHVIGYNKMAKIVEPVIAKMLTESPKKK